MITNLYFVRHAHSIYSTDELNRPLSERGKEDARKVTEILKNQRLDILISSPYKRALQTIEGLTGIVGIEIVIEEDFKERLLSEKPLNDFDIAIAKVWEEYSFSWEGGESNVVAQDRGVRALEKVLERYEGKNIAIGTHGNIMVLIMNYLDKRFDYTFWKRLSMPDIYKLSLDNRKLIDVRRIWDKS
ncbi:histidine phosphatase family protein [Paenibacillus chitinolyticus]|uniref:histidine phosphatase family protein n=1 Tax=Paenibacillus chitinolyticus TaxID=79263 RepID=UPI002DB88431|nr:histidine phosphatase family protein [Paenibacillus chitinolyticus]MEC0244832.1 histidine phosphatase family protein [Paenibacillus chitinolyticus]